MHRCLHCNQTKPAVEMSLLSCGDVSGECLECESRRLDERAAYMPVLLDKWHKDRLKEESLPDKPKRRGKHLQLVDDGFLQMS